MFICLHGLRDRKVSSNGVSDMFVQCGLRLWNSEIGFYLPHFI